MSRSIRVGDVMVGETFALSLTDLLDKGFVPGAISPSEMPRFVSPEAVVERACGSLVGDLPSSALLRAPTRVRINRLPAIGEPLRAVATVRFRTRDHQFGRFYTLAVELRRTGGTRVATFELGVEIPAVSAPVFRVTPYSGPEANAA